MWKRHLLPGRGPREELRSAETSTSYPRKGLTISPAQWPQGQAKAGPRELVGLGAHGMTVGSSTS